MIISRVLDLIESTLKKNNKSKKNKRDYSKGEKGMNIWPNCENNWNCKYKTAEFLLKIIFEKDVINY